MSFVCAEGRLTQVVDGFVGAKAPPDRVTEAALRGPFAEDDFADEFGADPLHAQRFRARQRCIVARAIGLRDRGCLAGQGLQRCQQVVERGVGEPGSDGADVAEPTVGSILWAKASVAGPGSCSGTETGPPSERRASSRRRRSS
jgi:hypothetical protein